MKDNLGGDAFIQVRREIAEALLQRDSESGQNSLGRGGSPPFSTMPPCLFNHSNEILARKSDRVSASITMKLYSASEAGNCDNGNIEVSARSPALHFISFCAIIISSSHLDSKAASFHACPRALCLYNACIKTRADTWSYGHMFEV